MADSKKDLGKMNKLEEVNKSLSFLNSIQNSAAHALIATSTDGTITSFNRKAEEMLGFREEELVGKETPAIFHDLDEVLARTKLFSEKLGYAIEPGFETFICHCRENLKNEFEWTYIHKSGNRFPVLLSITAIKDDDEVVGYLGTAQDLSEQKILEKQLIKKNSDLELAQSIAKIGSWSFNLEEGKITWSKEMYNIFPEDINSGEPAFEDHKATIHPEDVEKWLSTVGKCTDDGKPYLMRFRTHKKKNKNEVVWVEARGQGLIEEGKILSLSGTCQDITELVIKEEELENRARALSKAERAKSEFLANMSHEIRTPMNGIMGMLDLLGETELSHEQKDMLLTISTSSDALLRLLTDILDLSKIEAEKFELEFEIFNINKTLEEISTLMGGKAKESGSQVLIQNVEGRNPWYEGDGSRIRQILINFVSNAVKFTDKGKITIGYEALETKEGKTLLKFFVEDNGIGISHEDQEKLFNAFEQADSSITRKYGGTGLGLSICAKIAKLMDGRVYLKSKIDEGSIFYLEVTLKNAEAINDDTVGEIDRSKLAQNYPHRILLAEDNKVNQKVARLTLERFGYSCDVAENGIEVIEQLDSKPIDHYTLILMDIQMPGMDGITATKEILKKWGERAPTIVALTANAFTTDKENCLKAGMSDYLSKPLRKQALIDMLVKYSLKPV